MDPEKIDALAAELRVLRDASVAADNALSLAGSNATAADHDMWRLAEALHATRVEFNGESPREDDTALCDAAVKAVIARKALADARADSETAASALAAKWDTLDEDVQASIGPALGAHIGDIIEAHFGEDEF